MTAPDPVERPPAHAANDEAMSGHPPSVERAREPQLPLYAVCDRRVSGEVRTVIECNDLHDAQLADALLKSQGADTWIEVIPAKSIIP